MGLLLKDRIFNASLAALYSLTVSFLAALGESRFDLYLSMLTLEYLVLYALLRPSRKVMDFLALILVLSFSYFVALRIMEVLTG